MEKDMKKLNRAELMELLYRMRETADELNAQNEQLLRRAEEAEEKCALLEQQVQDEADRKMEDEALRAQMQQVLEKIETTNCAIMHCTEADRKIQAAQVEAEGILERARAEADEMRAEAERDIAQRREAFTRQCEELLRGQKALRRLMEN